MYYVPFDANQFKQLLKDANISIRQLTNPKNTQYCGVTDKTIRRATKCGIMTSKTYHAIMNKIDISSCVITTSKGSGMDAFKEAVDTLSNNSKEYEESSDSSQSENLFCPLIKAGCIGRKCALAVKLKNVDAYDVIYRCGLINHYDTYNYGYPHILTAIPMNQNIRGS